MRAACGEPGELPLDSTTHFQCCHSNATRAPIANPSNSAQLGGVPYHSPKLHPGPCNSVGMWPRTDTHTCTQTDTQTRVTTIHFASSTTHAKCNSEHNGYVTFTLLALLLHNVGLSISPKKGKNFASFH